MPEVKKIDTIVAKYVQDSLNQMRDSLVNELKSLQIIPQTCGGGIDSLLIQKQKNRLAEVFYQLQNWNTISKEAIEKKQKHLLQPYKTQIKEALDILILEGKYKYIINSEVLAVPLPICDNLNIKVAKLLQLTIPKDLEERFEKANCGFSVCLAEE